jgi:hypothetical protein
MGSFISTQALRGANGAIKGHIGARADASLLPTMTKSGRSRGSENIVRPQKSERHAAGYNGIPGSRITEEKHEEDHEATRAATLEDVSPYAGCL